MKLSSFIFFMINKYLTLIVMVVSVMLSAHVGNAYAATAPVFPACANPQGEVKVSYDNGIHGVAGDQNAYTGKDTVYNVSPSQKMQCLCPTDGNGIQTNWLKTSELSQDEISVLEKEGWIFIPNGSAWGLDESSYLAQNVKYTCGSTNNTSNSNSNSSSNSNTNLVAAASASNPDVFDLASTGNMQFIALVFASAFAFLAGGLLAAYKKRV